MLTLKVFGRFRLTDATGTDLTPKGVKTRGLVALLALSEGHVRRRAWLQDKLWSDRNNKNGADSLRQALMELRRALGDQAHVLKADRETVGFDPAHFSLEDNRPTYSGGAAQTEDIFTDLAIPDPEFEDWIRDQRQHLVARSKPFQGLHRAPTVGNGRPAIVFRIEGDGSVRSAALASELVSLATASLLDFADFQVYQEGRQSGDGNPVPKTGLLVRVGLTTEFNRIVCVLSIEHPLTGRAFWTRRIASVPGSPDDAFQFPVSAEIVEAVLMTLRRHGDDLDMPDGPAFFAATAQSLTFRFDQQSLREADRYLQHAWAWEPRPQYLAQRAFVRLLAQFQHRTDAFLDDQVDVATLAKEAIHAAPDSPLILGVRAHIEYLSGGSPRTSLQLVERAIDLDPLNAVNHAILSNTQLVLGQYTESRASSLKALMLAGTAEHRAYVAFFCCMASAAVGDYRDAIDHAEAALVLRPHFRAPLRYLVALYKHEGLAGPFNHYLQRLKELEPDFHIRRFLDADYPVTTMRRIPLIEAIAS